MKSKRETIRVNIPSKGHAILFVDQISMILIESGVNVEGKMPITGTIYVAGGWITVMKEEALRVGKELGLLE